MLSWPDIFQFGIFLSVALSGSRYMYTSELSLITSFSCYLSIQSFWLFFWFPYFTLLFLFIRLLVFPCVFSADLLVKFSFVNLKRPVLFVLLDPVLVSFECPFFRQDLWIYFFQLYSKTGLFSFVFHFSFQCILFLHIFFVLFLPSCTLSFFVAISLLVLVALFPYSGFVLFVCVP